MSESRRSRGWQPIALGLAIGLTCAGGISSATLLHGRPAGSETLDTVPAPSAAPALASTPAHTSSPIAVPTARTTPRTASATSRPIPTRSRTATAPAGRTASPFTGARPAADAHVTIVNNFDGQVQVDVNGFRARLEPGQRLGPINIKPDPHGNDGISVGSVQHPGCGAGGSSKYFDADRSFTITIGTDKDACEATTPATDAPDFSIRPAA